MPRKKKYPGLTLGPDGRYIATAQKDGMRKRFTSTDPEEALRKKAEWLSASESTPVKSFADVALEWQAQHWPEIGPGTQSSYKANLDRAVEYGKDIPFDDFGASDVRVLLQTMKAERYSASTVKKMRSMLKQIFDYAIVARYTKYNPVSAVRTPSGLPSKSREAPEDDVILRVATGLELPFGLFPFMLLYTGCRKGEILALTWEDIDFQARTITINKNLAYDHGKPYIKMPKTEAGVRTVPLLDALESALRPLRGKGLIFPNEDGGLMGSRSYERRWKAYCTAAGFVAVSQIPGKKKNGRQYYRTHTQLTLTAHMLRHGYATLLFEAGIDVKDAQQLLGHSDSSVTENVYTHIRQKRQKQSVDALNNYIVALRRSSIRAV